MRHALTVLSLALLTLAGCGQAPLDAAQPPRFVCDARYTAIAELQGREDTSPLAGRTVDVQGVVTANFQQGLSGFFIEAMAAARDADPESSEGLFVRVAEPRPEVRMGRLIRVRGVVSERGDGVDVMSMIDDVRETLDCGEAALPDPVRISAAVENWERYEGMRLEFPEALTVTGNAGLDRHGSLEVSLAGRLFHPTELEAPGEKAEALAAANRRARLRLDDNLLSENPRRIWYLPRRPADTRPLRVGSRVAGVRGVLEQRGERYVLQLTEKLAAIEEAPRPAGPPPIDNGNDPATLRVVAFNTLNFFNGDGAGGGFPTPRGAADAEALRRQRAKLVATLNTLAPDVVALMELENDGYGERSAIAALVAALNRSPGAASDYAFVDPGVPALGGDEIAVGIIYRTRRVAPLGVPARLEGGPFEGSSRVPLAASFEPVGGGAPFTVVANHFKSKGSCEEASGADRDLDDGQGCWNAARTAAAERLLDWLAQAPTGIGGGALILGDLNAYGQEDPVRALRARGYVDLLAGAEAYSYVYDGLSGRLDHAFAAPELAARVTGAAEWHINADELPAFAYDGEIGRRALVRTPWRSSDHDPLILGLRSR
jgi:hypothetical protein